MSRHLISVLALIAAISGAQAEEGHHWGYEGATGPEGWGHLSAEFEACAAGQEQSPIDLSGGIPATLPEVRPHWATDASWTVTNNGHTVQASSTDAGSIMLDGTEYQLLQFHFHHPSEHAMDGSRLPMEAHFVHKAADGRLAVIGVMLQGGGEPGVLDQVLAAAPREAGTGHTITLDPSDLMPLWPRYFRYQGSLTTPPCSEIVLWTVMAQPVRVSDAAIAAFGTVFPMDARPLQPMNRRFLLSN